MSLPGFLVLSDKSEQVFAGAFNLVAWLVLMPFLAAVVVRFSHRMNEAIFGQLPQWYEAGFDIGKIFFAVCCFLFALYGAALLSVFFLAQSGLIKNPWE